MTMMHLLALTGLLAAAMAGTFFGLRWLIDKLYDARDIVDQEARAMTDPAEKYRGDVDARHEMAMQKIGFSYQMLAPHREHFDRLLQADRDMDGLIDPTLYRDILYSKSFAQQVRLVRAALLFLEVAEIVRAEVETSSGRSSASTK